MKRTATLPFSFLEKQKTLDFDSLKAMAEKVEGSFVFTVLDKDDSIWFVVGDNPLCVMFYDGFSDLRLDAGNPLQDHQEAKAESAHRYSGAKGGRDYEN
ncbi:MAG: hypothetical protein ACLUN5_07715 [Oscillospiraceae bacterium]